jgi:hypothetical protein
MEAESRPLVDACHAAWTTESHKGACAHTNLRTALDMPPRAMADEPPARVALDTIRLSLKEQKQGSKGVELKNDQPIIFYSPKPANLVVFEGEPVMSSVHGANLLFAVNTNWEVFLYPPSSTFYLLDGSF